MSIALRHPVFTIHRLLPSGLTRRGPGRGGSKSALLLAVGQFAGWVGPGPMPAQTSADSSFQRRFWIAKLEGRAGHFATAESLFVQLLRERPTDYDTHIGLADVRLWAGRYDAAETDLEALSRIAPEDPEVVFRLRRVRVLRRAANAAGWQAGLEYYGEQASHAPATHSATASLDARRGRLRWRSAATVQQKFDRTDARLGGEIGVGLSRRTELTGLAHVAPGAEVLPQQTYGVRVTQKVGRRLVAYADYSFLAFADAGVHRMGPRLELYVGEHWMFGGRYAYGSTRFDGLPDAVANHAASVSVGYLYGSANLLQVSVGAGGESFALPSRDVIGGFSARSVGIGWRQFLNGWLGLSLSLAYQDRSDGTHQSSYTLGLLRRW